MKPKTGEAFSPQRPRQGIHLCQPGHVPVKSRVKTGDLFEANERSTHGPDGLEFVGEVLRRQRNQCSEVIDQFGVDEMGSAVSQAPVDHPVPHGPESIILGVVFQPAEEGIDRAS
jgi:hypothetical protein